MALTLILQILKQYWPYIAIGILILSTFTYIKILKSTIDNRNSEIEELKTDIISYKSEAKNCNNKINKQNEFEKVFKKNSDIQQRRFDNLTVIIDKIRIKNTVELRKVLLEKIPETCKESIKYLIDAAKGGREWSN